jgi:outer membrane protein assembly factor BamB
MPQKRTAFILILFLVAGWFSIPRTSRAEDWPMWGRDKTRNMVSPEKNPPTDWQGETKDFKTGAILRPARNIKWSAELGSPDTPVVSNGLVWVGSNNRKPRDASFKKDASVLICFQESDGRFLYQYVSPRLPDQVHDSTDHSLGCPPLVDGDRMWLLTNRCEALCLDIGPLLRRAGEPKVVWKVDMAKEFGVFRHTEFMYGALTGSVALYKDLVFAVTGNGVDESHINIPAPKAPSLIALDKNTGKLRWQDNSPTIKAAALAPVNDETLWAKSPLKQLMDRGEVLMHGQWTSPLVLDINGRGQVIVGQGDGWLRSFDALTGKLIWKCDINPKASKHEIGFRGTRNHFLATPVWHDGHIYIASGQHPEHSYGVGWLFCIDPTKQGDISFELEEAPGKGKPNPNSGVVWRYGGPTTKEDQKRLGRAFYFGRTMSTVAVQDGLVYAAELEGYLHCLDARTGMPYWVHDLKGGVSASPLWVDGKIYVPTDGGDDVWIFSHGKDKKEPKNSRMPRRIERTPIFANGVLYIATDTGLYAIREQK